MNKMLMANIEAAFPSLTTEEHTEILKKFASNMLFKVSLFVGMNANDGIKFPSSLEILFYNFTKGIILTVSSRNGKSWNVSVRDESCTTEHLFVLFGKTTPNKNFRMGIELKDVGDIICRLNTL